MNGIKGFKQSVFILLISLMLQSCASSKNIRIPPLKSEVVQLTHKEYLLVDRWVKKSLPSCSFLFLDTSSVKQYTERDIMQCIQDFSSKFTYHYSHVIHGELPDKLPRYLQKKIHSQHIDYYLSKKLLPFLSSLSTSELTAVLTFIHFPTYGESAELIKALIDQGAEAQDILIQRITSTNGSTCISSLHVLNKNQHLYQNNKTLRVPVAHKVINLVDKGYEEVKLEEGLYRKDDIFSAINDSAYLHCKDQVLAEALIRVNPDLRDTIRDLKGETPLHLFLRYFGTRGFSNPVKLGKMLITKNNINLKDKSGKTPLLILLQLYLNQSEEYVRMVKALIDAGSNIDLKDNEGVTSRELILKHPKLKALLQCEQLWTTKTSSAFLKRSS